VRAHAIYQFVAGSPERCQRTAVRAKSSCGRIGRLARGLRSRTATRHSSESRRSRWAGAMHGTLVGGPRERQPPNVCTSAAPLPTRSAGHFRHVPGTRLAHRKRRDSGRSAKPAGPHESAETVNITRRTFVWTRVKMADEGRNVTRVGHSFFTVMPRHLRAPLGPPDWHRPSKRVAPKTEHRFSLQCCGAGPASSAPHAGRRPESRGLVIIAGRGPRFGGAGVGRVLANRSSDCTCGRSI